MTGNRRADDPTKEILALRKELDEWVGVKSQGNWFPNQHKELETLLASSERNSILFASTTARLLAVFEANRGTSEVLRNQEQGWRRLANALEFYYWSSRIWHGHWASQGKLYDAAPPGFHHQFSLFFCLAVVSRRRDIADWFAKILRALYERGFAEASTDNAPFREFIRMLTSSYLDQRWPEERELSEQLGVYRELFTNWRNPGSLSQALVDACDFHITYAWPEGDKSDEQSFGYPFAENSYTTVFPVEILAFLELRTSFGLPEISFDHSLMNTPLGHVPLEKFVSNDLLLPQLAQNARKSYPL